jgi:septal ring factor EnvC (AmiA/AmiB activator)
MNTEAKTQQMTGAKLAASCASNGIWHLKLDGSSYDSATCWIDDKGKFANEVSKRWNGYEASQKQLSEAQIDIERKSKQLASCRDTVTELQRELQKEVELNREYHKELNAVITQKLKVSDELLKSQAYNNSLIEANKKPGLKRLWNYIF